MSYKLGEGRSVGGGRCSMVGGRMVQGGPGGQSKMLPSMAGGMVEGGPAAWPPGRDVLPLIQRIQQSVNESTVND